MNQAALSFEETHARRSDPATSHAAAKRAAGFAATHAGRILLALQQHGPMSPSQMYDFTGLSVVQCDRRRKEMIAAGFIRIKTLDDGSPVTHQGCEVWEAVPR